MFLSYIFELQRFITTFRKRVVKCSRKGRRENIKEEACAHTPLSLPLGLEDIPLQTRECLGLRQYRLQIQSWIIKGDQCPLHRRAAPLP